MGIGIVKGYRDIGIDTEMLRILTAQAEKMNLKMLHLLVFTTNKRAIHVYEKVGFKKASWVPKIFNRNGEYIDELVMIREIL